MEHKSLALKRFIISQRLINLLGVYWDTKTLRPVAASVSAKPSCVSSDLLPKEGTSSGQRGRSALDGVVRVTFERIPSSSGVMRRSCRTRITRFHAASDFFQPDAFEQSCPFPTDSSVLPLPRRWKSHRRFTKTFEIFPRAQAIAPEG